MKRKLIFLTISIIITSHSLYAQKVINAIIQGKAEVVDPNSITFTPGFEAALGSEFHAYISPNSTVPVTGTPQAEQPVSAYNHVSFPNSAGKNYIRTITPQVPLSEINKDEPQKYTTRELDQTIQYFDGLGRPLQTINIQASPNQKDIVQHIEYDEFGREANKYLPFESKRSENYGILIENPTVKTQQSDFYSNTLGFGSDLPISKTIFEASPLNRVLQQGAPGAVWQPDSVSPSTARSVQYKYITNTESISTWKYSNTCGAYITETFAANTLYGTEIIDEDKNKTIEYKDFLDKIILKQAIDSKDNKVLSTIYVYDEFDQLACVVPPLAIANGVTPSTNGEELCYHYRYNARKLMTSKKIPGAEEVLMYYDARDRLVLVQDGNMKNSEEWQYTKYDVLNRPIETGIIKNNGTLTATVINSVESSIELPFNVNDYNPESYTFYDDYTFINNINDKCYYPRVLSEYDYIKKLTADASKKYEVDPAKTDRNIGRVTATLIKFQRPVNTPETFYHWLLTVNYYDKFGRVIQTVADNHIKRSSDRKPPRFSTKYSFTGQVLETLEEQNNPLDGMWIRKKFEYDHSGRLISQRMMIKNEPEIVLSQNEYNEIGQLKTKRLLAKGPTDKFLQKVDYKYNIRGWLTNINDPGLSTNDGDYFGMTLNYHDIHETYNRYNGNIGMMSWAVKGSESHWYKYKYDGFSRLTEANCTDFRVKDITYDENGNIKTLFREGVRDNLTYNYLPHSNQLDWIKDTYANSPGMEGFPYNIESSKKFSYDANGNMISDMVRGVSTVSYDNNNMPKIISFNNGAFKTIFFYDIAGVKRRQMSLNENGVQQLTPAFVDYCGSFIYENNKLSTILMDEGRIVPQGTGYRYELFLKDHLGNTRAVISDAGNGITQLHQETHYYPFGGTMPGLSKNYAVSNLNDFQYNGKEKLHLNNDNNLFWLDYGARFYDPAIGRWHCIDNKAEKYVGMSPYNYAANNPVLFVDYDGNDFGVSVDMDNRTITISQTFYTDGTAKTTDLMNKAASYFNGQSGKFALSTSDGDFSINYDVKVVEGGDSDSNYEKAYKDDTANYVETDYGSDAELTIAGDYGSTKDGGDYVRMSNSEIVDDKVYQHEGMHTQGASHEATGKQGTTLNTKVVAGTLGYASKACKDLNINVTNGDKSYQLKTKSPQDQPKVVYDGDKVNLKGEVIAVQ